VTCFPQYTAYHASKAQLYMQENPTIREVNGTPGIFRWSGESSSYELYDGELSVPVANSLDGSRWSSMVRV
jgi:hypothetical protein